jgi:hypothetical protein
MEFIDCILFVMLTIVSICAILLSIIFFFHLKAEKLKQNKYEKLLSQEDIFIRCYEPYYWIDLSQKGVEITYTDGSTDWFVTKGKYYNHEPSFKTDEEYYEFLDYIIGLGIPRKLQK